MAVIADDEIGMVTRVRRDSGGDHGPPPHHPWPRRPAEGAHLRAFSPSTELKQIQDGIWMFSSSSNSTQA
ncbi:hypothetical protein U1Q18_030118 [Sarracenia purpurea var. burkii]